MTLSADILNQRSPYKLSQLGEFTFRFVTDQDIHYTVGFYKDTIFMDDGAAAYQAYVIERDRVAQYDEALAQEREAHNEGYLRRTTIQPGEKIAGLVYAKKGKGERVSAKLVLNGLEYYFEWKVPK